MKKIISTILISMFVLLIFANQPESMRSLATGGVFTDTWEDVYDPISLNSIEKFYFFTNLADFSYSYNEAYGEISDASESKMFEEFPFGIAFTNPFKKNLKHSFFLRFSNTLTPSLVQNGNFGEYEEKTSYYYDNDNDGLFDERSVVYEKEEDYQDNDKLFDFIWNNNIELDNYNLGFKLSLSNSSEEIDNAQTRLGESNFADYGYLDGFYPGANQVDIYGELYNMDEEQYKHRYSEKGKFSTELSDKEMSLLISMEKPSNFLIDDNTLRFDFGFDNITGLSRDTDDSYLASFEEIIVRDTLVVTGDISDVYKRKIEMKSNNFSFATCLNKELTSKFNGENGFWEIGLYSGFSLGEKEDSWSKHLITEEKTDSLNSLEYTIIDGKNYYSSSDESGDLNVMDFSSYFLMNLPLNKTANFGYGLTYNYSYSKGEYDAEEKIENIDFSQIGQELDLASEYQRRETQYISGEKETIIKTNEFVIPVALEFKIPTSQTSSNDGFGIRNFLFRLGSTFIYNYTSTEETYNKVDSQINFIITEYGDGDVSESYNADNEMNSSKQITNQAYSSKIFTAGIGYQHSENVSIDLGGKYDYNTEDYFVGLSFTLSK